MEKIRIVEMKKIAVTISHLFDPILIYAFLGTLAIFRSDLTGFNLERMLALFILLMILPPAALLAWAVINKKVINWDVSDRQQRITVLAVFLVMTLFDLWLVKIFGKPALFKLFVFFSVWYLGFFIITLFWKISGHVAGLTLATLLIIYWYGTNWWPIFLLIPVLAWARVASKNHSMAQVIAGLFYSWIIFTFVKIV